MPRTKPSKALTDGEYAPPTPRISRVTGGARENGDRGDGEAVHLAARNRVLGFV